MSDKLPKVISSSEIKIGDFTMHVHMLDNGVRVIDKEDVEAFFSTPNLQLTEDEATELARALAA